MYKSMSGKAVQKYWRGGSVWTVVDERGGSCVKGAYENTRRSIKRRSFVQQGSCSPLKLAKMKYVTRVENVFEYRVVVECCRIFSAKAGSNL